MWDNKDKKEAVIVRSIFFYIDSFFSLKFYWEYYITNTNNINAMTAYINDTISITYLYFSIFLTIPNLSKIIFVIIANKQIINPTCIAVSILQLLTLI